MTLCHSIGRRLFSSGTFRKSALARYQKGQILFNFKVQDTKEIDELDLALVKLEHEPTGAAHWHVVRDDPNCAFCVAFRTPVSDSTGVPHILEHTTLCGSDKYPVRDPFFKMLNRSLASYMNAWTASEHTAYPFCTANTSDYANLRDVYCDSVFSPKLSKLDFLQEGWRLENEDPKDIDSPLKFKGVVYNEMKGVFSDNDSLFAQRLQQHRFPGSVYSHVSGGDPPNIVDLTHEQLVNFHKQHYHPSNALFYTYGNMCLEETLGYLDKRLSSFSKVTPKTIQVPDLPTSPKTIEVSCPFDPNSDQEKQCRFILSFLMNDVSSDPQETFHLRILSHLLLDGSSAPLYKALINSNIGLDYAAGTGYDTSTKVASFSVGLQGIKEADFGRVNTSIIEALKVAKSNGFSQSRIDAVLHLLELGTKYQSSQYGLGLSHKIISSWVYGLEPESELAVNDKIDEFKGAYAQGGLFEDLIDKYFFSKKPLTLVMKPSAEYAVKLENDEKRLLESKILSFSTEEKVSIYKTNLHLISEQEKKTPTDLLPCLKFEDLQRETRPTEFREFHHSSAPKTYWRTTPKSNGITFVKTIIPIGGLSKDEVKLLPLMTQSLTELGIKGMAIEDFDEQIKMVSGGLTSSLLLGRQPITRHQNPEIGLLLGTHALDRNVPKALDLLQRTISKTDFSNLARLQTVLSGTASSMMNSIASSGHSFAMLKAASALSKRGRLDEEFNGLSQSLYLNELLESEDIAGLAQRMKSLAERILSVRAYDCRTAVVSTDESSFDLVSQFSGQILQPPINVTTELDLDPDTEAASHIEMPFSTNYAAKVYQFNPYNLRESAQLSILAKILRSGLLHREIREKGGAYGGGASYSPLNGTFSFFSYRDPNPTNSLCVFDSAPGWFLDHELTEQELLEARLSVFSMLDAPQDISSEGLHMFYHGISDVDRQLYRDLLFAVDKAGLQKTVEKLFEPAVPSKRCVIGGGAGVHEAWRRMGTTDWTEQERLDVMNFFGVDTLEPREWIEAGAAPSSPVEDSTDQPLTAAQLMNGQDDAVINTRLYMQDNVDPLGINDAGYQQQLRLREASGQAELDEDGNGEKKRSMSICSPNFHPRHFIRTVHRDTSFADILGGVIHLEGSSQQRSEPLKNLVKHNFGRFINAKNSVELVYQDMKQKGLVSEDHGLKNSFDSIQGINDHAAFQKAQEVFHPLLARRNQEELIRRRLRIYEKYSFILSLGGKFERYIQVGDYQQASYDYRKAKALLHEMRTDSVFRKVLEKTWNGHFANVLGELKSELFKKLANPIFPYDVHAKMIEYLLELDAHPDPSTFYLESCKGYILNQVRLCRDRTTEELGSVAEKEGESAEAAFEWHIDMSLAHNTDRILAANDVYAHSWRIRRAFFSNIAEIFEGLAPSFSKFTSSLFEGKLQSSPQEKRTGDQMAVYVAKLRDFAQELATETIGACKAVLADSAYEHSSTACAFVPRCLHSLQALLVAAEESAMSDIMVDQIKSIAIEGCKSLVGRIWTDAQADSAKLPHFESWEMTAEGIDLSSILTRSFEALVSQSIQTTSAMAKSFKDHFPDASLEFPETEVTPLMADGLCGMFVAFVEALKKMALDGDQDAVLVEDMIDRMDLEKMGTGYKLLIILTNIVYMQSNTITRATTLFSEAGLGEAPTDCHLKISELLGLAYYHISDLYLGRRRGQILALVQEGFDSFYWQTEYPSGQSIRPYISRLLSELIVIQNEILDVSPLILRTLMISVSKNIFKEFLAGYMNLSRISLQAYIQARLELGFVYQKLVTAITEETEELIQECYRILDALVASVVSGTGKEMVSLVQARIEVISEQTALQYSCFKYT